MGEQADYMLNGDDCVVCGAYMGDGDGFPRACEGCRREEKRQPRVPRFNPHGAKQPTPGPDQIACPHCKRVVKTVGLGDHVRSKHPEIE